MGVLINGNGNARIYAGQDADWFASLAGNVTCRTSVGNKMVASAVDASTIGVSDGVIITKEGRRIQLDAGLVDLFEIPTGSVGVTNYYIIGYHLFTGTDGIQEAETFVRLMSSSSETITEDTFRGGASDVYVSVARVQQVGVNLGTITALLPELSTLNSIAADLGDKSAASAVTGNTAFDKINQINSDLTELLPHVLWTNPDDTQDFAGTNLTIQGLSTYKYIEVEYRNGTASSYGTFVNKFKVELDKSVYINHIGFIKNSPYRIVDDTREIYFAGATLLSIMNNHRNTFAVAQGTITEADYNTGNIPVKIIGYK